MASVFTMIRQGDLPGRFLWRDEVCFAILTINPITTGHTLVIPNAEVDHWLDLDDEVVAHLHVVGKHLGTAIAAEYAPPRVVTMIAGFEVPHTHLHVLGAASMADMDFANAARDPDPAALDATATALRSRLRDAGHGAWVPD